MEAVQAPCQGEASMHCEQELSLGGTAVAGWSQRASLDLVVMVVTGGSGIQQVLGVQ